MELSGNEGVRRLVGGVGGSCPTLTDPAGRRPETGTGELRRWPATRGAVARRRAWRRRRRGGGGNSARAAAAGTEGAAVEQGEPGEAPAGAGGRSRCGWRRRLWHPGRRQGPGASERRRRHGSQATVVAASRGPSLGHAGRRGGDGSGVTWRPRSGWAWWRFCPARADIVQRRRDGILRVLGEEDPGFSGRGLFIDVEGARKLQMRCGLRPRDHDRTI